MEEELRRGDESARRPRDPIFEMLDHVGTSLTRREGKRTIPERDEQDEGKGEDSPMSHEAEPSLSTRIQETTTNGHGRRRRWRRHEKSSCVSTSDEEGQPANTIERKTNLQSKPIRGIDSFPI